MDEMEYKRGTDSQPRPDQEIVIDVPTAFAEQRAAIDDYELGRAIGVVVTDRYTAEHTDPAFLEILGREMRAPLQRLTDELVCLMRLLARDVRENTDGRERLQLAREGEHRMTPNIRLERTNHGFWIVDCAACGNIGVYPSMTGARRARSVHSCSGVRAARDVRQGENTDG
jgi:hypothetical protein